MARYDFFRAYKDETVFQVQLQAGDAFTADATDYHSFTVRIVRDGQSIGEKVGETYSLAARSLVASEPVNIYDDDVGLAMIDGEVLALYIEETGSPSALERVTVWVNAQRRAR